MSDEKCTCGAPQSRVRHSHAYERYGDRRRKAIAIHRMGRRVGLLTTIAELEQIGDGELNGLEDALRVVCDELDEQTARQP